MTPKEASILLTTALAGGCRPHDAWMAAGGIKTSAPVYATVLTAAGVDYDTASAALVAYLGEPTEGAFPKMLPDPGALIARTPGHRQRVLLDGQAGAVWARVYALRGSLGAGAVDRGVRMLAEIYGRAVIPAILAGLDAVGGWDAACNDDVAARVAGKRFEEAYRASLGRVGSPALLADIALPAAK